MTPTTVPANKDAVSIPPPCDLALSNEDVLRVISMHVGRERGVFVCVMVADAESCSLAHLEFIPIKKADSDPPDHLKAFYAAIPSLRSHLRSYEVKKHFILAASLALPNGEAGCQFRKCAIPAGLA